MNNQYLLKRQVLFFIYSFFDYLIFSYFVQTDKKTNVNALLQNILGLSHITQQL